MRCGNCGAPCFDSSLTRNIPRKISVRYDSQAATDSKEKRTNTKSIELSNMKWLYVLLNNHDISTETERINVKEQRRADNEYLQLHAYHVDNNSWCSLGKSCFSNQMFCAL